MLSHLNISTPLSLSSHRSKDAARLRSDHLLSRIEGPHIGVDEEERGSIGFSRFEQALRGASIKLRQPTTITLSMGIDDLAIQFLKSLLNV